MLSIDRRLGLGGDLRSLAGWAGKLHGAITRIAGIFALADGEGAVGVDHVAQARRLVPYLISEQWKTIGLMRARPDERARGDKLTKAVAALVTAHGDLIVSMKELRAQLKEAKAPDLPPNERALTGWLTTHADDLRQLGVMVGEPDRRRRRRFSTDAEVAV